MLRSRGACTGKVEWCLLELCATVGVVVDPRPPHSSAVAGKMGLSKHLPKEARQRVHLSTLAG